MLRYRFHPAFRLARAAVDPPPREPERPGAPDPVTADQPEASVRRLIALAARLGLGEGAAGTVAQERTRLRRSAWLAMPQALDVTVSELELPVAPYPLAVRRYRPTTAIGDLPVIVYYHGGGWVTGDLDTHDPWCRVLAITSGCEVVSVAYRLAPEAPFPAAADDAIAAFRFVAGHPLPGQRAGEVAVAGDSAGGTLAAIVAQQCRADATAPVAQLVLYPAGDLHLTSASIDRFADGYFLTRAKLHWFRGHYAPDPHAWDDERGSPLLAADVAGVAPALVATAGFDPLVDEGDAYARRLAAAAVSVDHRRFGDQIHGFASMGLIAGGLDRAERLGTAFGRLVRAGR